MGYEGKYSGSKIDELLGKAETALQKEVADTLYAEKGSTSGGNTPIIRANYELELVPGSAVYCLMDLEGCTVWFPSISTVDYVVECELILDCSIEGGPIYYETDNEIFWENDDEPNSGENGVVYDVFFRSFNGGSSWYATYKQYSNFAS